MLIKETHDINMIVYNNHDPIVECKLDFLGFMGVFLKGIDLGLPACTKLNIEFYDKKRTNSESEVIPMIVNRSEKKGTGLRLEKFDKETVHKWVRMIKTVLSDKRTKNR